MGADLWQTFDYPSDTLLPNMMLGFDSNTGIWNLLTSWKGENDPSTGIFSVVLSEQMPTQLFILKNESTPHWRSGPWDKSKFVGIPGMSTQYLSGFTLDDNVRQGTRYFSYSIYDKTLACMDISSDGILQIMISENGENWGINWAAPVNTCEIYGACGPYGFCKASDPPVCKCLKGFKPKSVEEWSKGNWTGGCVRQTKLSCETHTNTSVSTTVKKDEFWKMENSKIPDLHEYLTSLSDNVWEDCKTQCLSNCSCLAYAYIVNIGCLVWSKDLIDIQEFISGGEDIFIRLAHTDSGDGKRTKLIVSLIAIVFISILGSIVFGWQRFLARKKGNFEYRGNIEVTTTPFESIDTTETSSDTLLEYIREHDRSEQFMYNFDTIFIATNHFSSTNKLGEGGFGPVFKGKLPVGKEIAVKRLSRSSGQGVEEFKNEMLLIAKLQHKNLVKIMDPSRRAELDWARRYVIINGVARGLLYLHHDSCLKVIHRDLKVSNILLDEKMNPKISDFGLARIVQGTENLENTQKVVGTRGYMSPEYAMGGIFSEKSDVYSFGVLVLEIISGRKINCFYYNDQLPSLLAYAWHLWSQDRGLELVDEVLADSYSSSEVMRCLQIGLLCVQDNAVDRPGMPEVVLMLSSNTYSPRPKEPIFTFHNSVSPPTCSGVTQMGIVLWFFLFIFTLLPFQYSAQLYNITPSNPLAVGETLVSPGSIYEIGFFSLSNSTDRYLGLWHNNIYPRKYVWLANREKPLSVADTSATLRISSNGSLELVDGKQNTVWSTTEVSASNSTSAVAVLLDTGNFVVKDDIGADEFIWQSFDYPCDTMLPGQLLGFDSKSGKRYVLTSWKSDNDPSMGIFLSGLSAETPSQVFVWIDNGSTPYYRSGPWDKSKFIGVVNEDTNWQYLSGYTLDDDVKQGTKYLSFYTLVDNISGYTEMSSDGSVRLLYSENGKNWSAVLKLIKNPCDVYGTCGPFGVCRASESPICKCLKGFVPKLRDEWSEGNWSGGCVRQTKLFCDRQTNISVSTTGKIDDGFSKMARSKVPDHHEFRSSLGADANTFEDCKMVFPSDGVDLYIRLAQSELDEAKPIKLIVSLTAIGFMSLLAAIVFCLYRLRANQKGKKIMKGWSREGLLEYIGNNDSSELKIYDFDNILVATDGFSIKNKLGQGGFGPVYKGMLPEGKEIAVKRLSSSSGQGVEEFKNEILLISKLQHKNLVRIMGCCVKEDEKLLVYEFMPNKSLDTFLFDQKKRAELDWATRFNIIQGVARGLLYLHHDSYLKIVHRDLKVSNILLDEKMNPKISDFGLARIVEGTQDLENTQKVVGTRGYISPEYAMGGIYSEKSDVYSFGVLVLEVISSKKTASFYSNDQQLGFLAHAWKLWNEDKGLELVDELLGDSYSSSEVMKCVHIGLLCVQDNATDRPTMTDIALMLSSEIDGPKPKEPLFTIQNSVSYPKPQYENIDSSKNEASITVIEGR
ncbi:PREDICTED: G-type lectin S-receptor-like serine/threonine-protein kinase SD1-29-like [Fragaria vesca subsp. vesca]